jgi:hypothetical protein
MGVIDYSRIGGYPGPKQPGSNDDWGITDWKDVVMAGGSRVPVAAGTPGSAGDTDYYTGQQFGRMDWIDAGAPGASPEDYISGSGSADGSGRTTRASAMGGGGGGAPAQAAIASLTGFGTNLQQALQGYLSGVKRPEDIFATLSALRSVGQIHPNLEQSFLAAGGAGLTPEQIQRLKELAAQLSVQRGILPTNIG